MLQSTINLSTSVEGSNVAGDSYTIHCMVRIPSGLSALPEITWTNPTSVEIQGQTNNTVINNSAVFFSTVTLTPLLTSQSGVYTCQVSVQSPSLLQPLNISDMVTVSVQSKHWYLYSIKFNNIIIIHTSLIILSPIVSVPSPTVEVFITSESGPFYAGSSLHIICIAAVDSTADAPYMLNIVWKKSGVKLENDYHLAISNITKFGPRNYQSDLHLHPLSTSLDRGVYTCQVEIDPSATLMYVRRTDATTSVVVNIQGKNLHSSM